MWFGNEVPLQGKECRHVAWCQRPHMHVQSSSWHVAQLVTSVLFSHVLRLKLTNYMTSLWLATCLMSVFWWPMQEVWVTTLTCSAAVNVKSQQLLLLLLLLHLFNSLFTRTAWVCQHQKGKSFWILSKQEMMGWRWHQLNHMQIICTLLQTDNHGRVSKSAA